jgi:hypothetical protein
MNHPFRSSWLRLTLPFVFIVVATSAASAQERVAAQANIAAPAKAAAQEKNQTGPYLDDRGTGMATSMFGTYVRRGELLVYPFFEAYVDKNLEYKPDEWGYKGDLDYRGSYKAKEALIWGAYGITDKLAVEFETAVIRATFDKAAADLSALPSRVTQSGLGDVEGQIRYRWRQEDAERPEVFSYFEAVIPHHGEKFLVGTSGWELKFGTGFIRGFRWGTITTRAALEYVPSSSSPFDLGEYGVEYLKRVSPQWRVYLGVEGTQDEVGLITEAQWHVSQNAFIRFNNGLGLTSKSTDWAPEIGVVFSFPMRK